MSLYRGLMPFGGKDRQSPVEDPYVTNYMLRYLMLPPTELPEVVAPVARVMSTREERTMGRRFTVLDDFFSDEFQTQYLAGYSYEARDEDEKLLGLLDQWIEEGKVREGGPEAQVTGTAEVTEADETDEDAEKA